MLMLCRRKILACKFLNDKEKIERECGYKKLKGFFPLKITHPKQTSAKTLNLPPKPRNVHRYK